MSKRFPDINSRQMVKVAELCGFVFDRQAGSSHAIYKRLNDKKRVTIPMHGKKSLKRKTIKSICRDLDITVENLKNYMHQI